MERERRGVGLPRCARRHVEVDSAVERSVDATVRRLFLVGDDVAAANSGRGTLWPFYCTETNEKHHEDAQAQDKDDGIS